MKTYSLPYRSSAVGLLLMAALPQGHAEQGGSSEMQLSLCTESQLSTLNTLKVTFTEESFQKEANTLETSIKNVGKPDNLPNMASSDMTVQASAKKAATSVVTLAGGITKLRDFWTTLDGLDVAPSKLQTVVDGRSKLADCAEAIFKEATRAAKIVEVNAPGSGDAAAADAQLKDAKRNYVHIAQRAIFDQQLLALFLGPSFTVNGSDKFKTGAELSALYDGGAGSVLNAGRLIVEFSYKTNGVVDTEREAGADAPEINPNDVIRSSPGQIRFSAGASTGVSDYYSVALTGGLSTIPGGGGDFPKPLRPHGQLSFLHRSFLGEGLYSRLSLGYAFDRYWLNREIVTAATADAPAVTRADKAYNRFVVEGLVLTSGVEAPAGISYAGRVTLNTPISGRGPSEVRLSILISMSFLDFFKKLAPTAGG